MQQLKGIALAVEHAQRQRDALAEAHAKAQRAVSQAMNQLEQLESYSRDTDAKWIHTATAAHSAEVLRHYYQFGGRLQDAIQMQNGVIAGLREAVVKAHTLLIKGEFRLAAVQKLYENRVSQAQQLKNRREQIQFDELATMQFLRNKKAQKSGTPYGT